MFKHVLVPLDGSELAEQALDYAKRMVGPSGRISLLAVLDVPDVRVYTLFEVPLVFQENTLPEFTEHLEKSGREYLNRIASDLQRAGYIIDTKLAHDGEPADVIIEEAIEKGVDVIVMSTHGRTGLSRWLFGSVTQKVLSVMPCPVLVVKGSTVAVVAEAETAKTVEEPVDKVKSAVS